MRVGGFGHRYRLGVVVAPVAIVVKSLVACPGFARRGGGVEKPKQRLPYGRGQFAAMGALVVLLDMHVADTFERTGGYDIHLFPILMLL